MRFRRPAFALLFVLGALSAHGVDLDDLLQSLLDRALTVSITARVTDNGRETVQSYELTRVTISGRAVRLRLEGGNLTIIAEFTPYEDENGILLVAEGRIILRNADNEEVQYRTSLRSVPLGVGERVVFYPLGQRSSDVALADGAAGALNVELEVEVSPFVAGEG